MGKVHDGIDGRLREFIEAQHVFFVASAPLDGGRVNLSPKGVAGTFTVVDDHTVAYLDITASGAETIAHLRDNGRITLMFCSFGRSPNVVRLHGRGRVVTVYDEEYPAWVGRFGETRGARAVVVVDVQRVSDSCGYGVPLLEYAGERDLLPEHMARKGADGIVEYRRLKNRTSIDGLPAFDADPADTAGPAEPAPAPPVGRPVPGWAPVPAVGPTTLAGRYVDLEPLGAGHADELYDATCGPGREPLWTYLSDDMPRTRAAFGSYVDRRSADPKAPSLAIRARGRGVEGVASWLRADPANGSVEVGSILLGPGLQRTAAATEAMWLMAGHAFGLGYRRYEWKCDALNAPSRTAAARLGFTFEGVFRNAVVYKGRNRDTAWFSVTDTEWTALAPAYEQWLDPANFADPGTGGGQRLPLSRLTAAALAQHRAAWPDR